MTQYVIYLILVLAVSFWFKHSCKNMHYIDHIYHNKLTNTYTLWLILSITIKLAQTSIIFSYDSDTLVV